MLVPIVRLSKNPPVVGNQVRARPGAPDGPAPCELVSIREGEPVLESPRMRKINRSCPAPNPLILSGLERRLCRQRINRRESTLRSSTGGQASKAFTLETGSCGGGTSLAATITTATVRLRVLAASREEILPPESVSPTLARPARRPERAQTATPQRSSQRQ